MNLAIVYATLKQLKDRLPETDIILTLNQHDDLVFNVYLYRNNKIYLFQYLMRKHDALQTNDLAINFVIRLIRNKIREAERNLHDEQILKLLGFTVV